MNKYYFAIACALLSILLLFIPVLMRYDAVSRTSATVGPQFVPVKSMISNDCALMGVSAVYQNHGFPFTTSSNEGPCGGGASIYPVGALLDIIIAVNIIYFVRNVAKGRLKR